MKYIHIFCEQPIHIYLKCMKSNPQLTNEL